MEAADMAIVVTASAGESHTWAFQAARGGKPASGRGHSPELTANAMELKAAVAAFRSIDSGTNVLLKSRLDYLIQGVLALLTEGSKGNRGWYLDFLRGRAKNQALWTELSEELLNHHVEVARANEQEHKECKVFAKTLCRITVPGDSFSDRQRI